LGGYEWSDEAQDRLYNGVDGFQDAPIGCLDVVGAGDVALACGFVDVGEVFFAFATTFAGSGF
jgi:hypothetical protein